MSPFRGLTPVPRHALHVMNTTIQSSSVSIGWTVDPEVLAKVKEDEAKGLSSWMMLLIFDKSRRREERKIVPLRDCIAYLALRSVGETRVFGQVLCGMKKDVYRMWLSQSGSSWAQDVRSVVVTDTSNIPDALVSRGYGFVGPEMKLDLQVPAEAFAPPPSEREAKWVNRFFNTTPRDQCAYRRRRIFAYTVQPLIALAACVVIGALQIVGFLAVLAKPNLSIWKGPPDGSRGGPWSGNFFKDYDEGINFIVFPVLWWAPAIVSVIVARFGWPDTLTMCPLLPPPTGYLTGWAALGGVMVPAALLFGLGVVTLGRKLVAYTKTESTVERVKGALAVIGLPLAKLWLAGVRLYHKLMMLQEEDIDVLTMPWQEGGIYSLQDLPASKRTIRLRFQDLKARVCRPFAK